MRFISNVCPGTDPRSRDMRSLLIVANLGLLVLLSLTPVPASAQAPTDEAISGHDPMALTEEMKAWAHGEVTATDSDLAQAQQLLRALQELVVKYQIGQTGTAADVFETQQFNCVSFSFLFVGLSRYLGLDTHFLRAVDNRGVVSEGELRVVSKHMSAGIQDAGRSRVLEFRFIRPAALSRFERLSDERAKALYLSNLGAESLQGGDPAAAIALFERALQTDAGLPEIWVNLGVAQKQAGDVDSAEKSYRHALTLDPKDVPAYLNLASLLWQQDQADASDQLLELLSKAKVRDPYACLVLGDYARREERLEDAERFYRRAVRLDRTSPEAQAALGLILARTGRSGEAKRRLKQAFKLDSENARVLELARRLQDPGTVD